jgi:hypothetical protein
MTSKPPPSRYKVIERGRRLEVIDTLTGQPASRSLPPPRADGGGGRQGGVEDGDSFTTRRWYDDKAPRRIRLNFATRKRFDQLRMTIAIVVALLVAFAFLFWPFFVPLLVVAGAVGWQQRVQARTAVTRFLDGFDQGR